DITGLVLDPSGAVIPNASVTITNDAIGTTQTHTTNGEGVYRFSLLSPGTYSVSVSLQNFQKAEQKAAVSIGQTTTSNLTLQLESNQTVEVSDNSAAVQTDSAQIST